MQFSQSGDAGLAERGQVETDHATIRLVLATLDETEHLGSSDQLDHAVVPNKEVLSGITYGRATWIIVSLDRKKQLVLDVGEPNRGRLIFAPPIELAESGTGTGKSAAWSGSPITHGCVSLRSSFAPTGAD